MHCVVPAGGLSPDHTRWIRPRYRFFRLRPNETHLSTPGHQLLMTRFGAADVLGSIGKGHRYADLLPHTIEIETRGIRVRVLDLARLIAVKEETGQEKDLATLPIQRRTLELAKRRT